MPSLDKIVKVVVSKDTTPIAQQSFAQVLVLSFDTPPGGFSEDIKSYNSEGYTTDFDSTRNENAFLSRLFSQRVQPEKAFVGFKLNTDTDVASALDRISNVNDEWYCVCVVGASVDDDDKKAVASWVASRKKICILQDTEASTLTATKTDDLGSDLKNSSNERSAVFWTENQRDFIDAGITGLVLPQPVGSTTFAYQTLVGVPVSNSVDVNASTVLENKNINYYSRFANRNMTFLGKVASGDFLDIIISQDWIVARIQENIAQLLSDSDKIPYTDAGIQIISNATRSVLDLAVTENIIAPSPTIETKSVDLIPRNERANRKYGNIDIFARFTGAIQSVEYKISLEV